MLHTHTTPSTQTRFHAHSLTHGWKGHWAYKLLPLVGLRGEDAAARIVEEQRAPHLMLAAPFAVNPKL